MAISLDTCKPGDILHLANGHTARVTYVHRNDVGLVRPRWVRAIYHHPTDLGWNEHIGDWTMDGVKESPGSWPEGADVVRVSPASANAGVSRTITVATGEHIRAVAERMVLIAAKEKTTVHATFNAVGLVALPNTLADDIVDTYHSEIDIACDRYRAFPRYSRD